MQWVSPRGQTGAQDSRPGLAQSSFKGTDKAAGGTDTDGGSSASWKECVLK